ncbi:putative COP9 signalosome complex subunit 8 [Paratrimastix pyriformis]|uniref:COP9 signalosome complex subunit 8 n=1 Tax=Paratrimastix pyriformis TaxID=342808 RepID=A0ABQ8UD86_9EUKA|nr:putative COP9 signalosome complex subunit 8 [Paratrimastix pyriformis]|eukprot:GAFH01005317.1.p2 GENE.GAFH01005317.1~~GAFH01005317.1.p2  ORF type:complete len:211 (+),score=26.50 GAFH01005317.1:32-634(+)
MDPLAKLGEDINAAIAKKNFREAAKCLVEFELQACNQPMDAIAPTITMEMLALLVLEDYNNARYLWKRLPPAAKRTRDLARAWMMGAALFKKDYPAFYAASNHAWNARCRVFVDRILETVRAKNAETIGRSYTVVSIGDIAPALGMTPDEALAFARTHGWEYDAATRMVKPVAPPPRVTAEAASLDLISNMTQYVIGLDA